MKITLAVVSGFLLLACLVGMGFFALSLLTDECSEAGQDGFFLATDQTTACLLRAAADRPADPTSLLARLQREKKVLTLPPKTRMKVLARHGGKDCTMVKIQVVSGPYEGTVGYQAEWVAPF